MNEQELQSILNKLSAQAEMIRKKIDISKQIESLDGWITKLAAKAAELAELGAVPVVEVASKIAELQAEREDLRSLQTPASPEAIQSLLESPPARTTPSPVPVSVEPLTPWREPISDEDIKEMEGLSMVIDTQVLDAWSHEERWLQYDSWASQWRLLISRYPSDVVRQSPLLRRVFGKIRDRMKADGPPLWYIEGLDEKRKADWQAKYKDCEARIHELASVRKEEESEGNTQEKAIWTLMTLVREFDTAADREEALRKLKHQIRESAKFKHLREEVVEIIEPVRSMIESEFAFLWGKTVQEEAVPIRSMSNRDLVARLLRRMKAKTLIGACHGPFEQIYKGVPEQDKGRAKEILEYLGKIGIIRFKGSIIGIRISIEPKRMPIVDHLINGEETNVLAINALLNGEVKV